MSTTSPPNFSQSITRVTPTAVEPGHPQLAPQVAEAPKATTEDTLPSSLACTASWAKQILAQMELPNAGFCSVFIIAFVIVETRLAQEVQYQTLFILFSPIALLFSSVYVCLQLLALLEKETASEALKHYFVRFWQPMDFIIVCVLWAKFHDSFSISQEQPDPRGFESITNDNKAAEWYFLLALRAFNLVFLLRALGPFLRTQFEETWQANAPEWLVTTVQEVAEFFSWLYSDAAVDSDATVDVAADATTAAQDIEAGQTRGQIELHEPSITLSMARVQPRRASPPARRASPPAQGAPGSGTGSGSGAAVPRHCPGDMQVVELVVERWKERRICMEE